MDFHLTSEQLAVRSMVHEFAETEIAPIADAIDAEHRFPEETVKKMAELGLLGMIVPEELGGAGLDYVAYAVAIEELARVCASHAVIVSVNNSLLCYPVMTFANDEQKRRFLVPAARGEMLGAYCLTEPNAGSNAANLETVAARDGNDYVLNGTKLFVTNAGPASLLLAYTVTDRSKGTRGISAFLIEADRPGVQKGAKERKMGLHASDTREIAFVDCRVPAANLLGQEGQGYKIALDTLAGGRIGIAAQAVGIAQASLEAAQRYANERVQFGKPIGEFAAVQDMLADMATQTEAARLLTFRAACLKDQGRPHALESSVAKLYASETATHCADCAVQIHGGYGYLADYKVERFYRDAKVCEIYEGTSEIQKMVIALNVLKQFEGAA
ncbi:MAG TPA: acyl-CoA dehydrogenase [Candidatus Saccharimonadales bacterium]|nr:acyl-CoA dehydrogenase [Candidatus Saccharimonadales bacterium]